MNAKLIAAALVALNVAAVSPAIAAEPAPAQAEALSTMTVDGPDHRVYRFDYVAGEGWKFAGHSAVPSRIRVALAGALPAGLAAGLKPQTTFVDAATGYRFVWQPGQGWKFAGTANKG